MTRRRRTVWTVWVGKDGRDFGNAHLARAYASLMRAFGYKRVKVTKRP